MSAEYVPREGSVAAQVLAHLHTLPAGSRILARDLAAAIGIDGKGLSTFLRKAIDAGQLVQEGGGTLSSYGLPAPAHPGDGKLVIATFSDGDVSVLGGVLANDGSTMYTREQMTQLVAQMTRPHVPIDTLGAGT